jgi:hypothetical protein
MADATNIRKWDNSETAVKLTGLGSAGGYFETRDEDFGLPERIKKVYAVYFTYMSTTALTAANLLHYSLDGIYSWVSNRVVAQELGSTDGTAWGIGCIEFSPFIECQSIQLQFDSGSADLDINDVSLEYRPIYRKVISKIEAIWRDIEYGDNIFPGGGDVPMG